MPTFSLLCLILLFSIHFLLPTCIDVGSLKETKGLEDKLSGLTGIYKIPPSDPSLVVKLNKTILLTTSNYGFLNHLFNFDCFMQRLNFKYLVMALDKKAYDHLSEKTSIPVHYLDIGGQEASHGSENFRSEKYNFIVMQKVYATLLLLQLGYDILFSDTDLAVLRDPIPYLLWDNIDYVHSFNGYCERKWDFLAANNEEVEGNTGFYYLKSNNRTIKLLQNVIEAAPKYPEFDDQRILWKVLRVATNPSLYHIKQCQHFQGSEVDENKLIACMLDSCLFTSGAIAYRYTYEKLQEELQKLSESVCTIHATYLIGNHRKMKAMMNYGLWLYNGVKNDCSFLKVTNGTFNVPIPRPKRRKRQQKSSSIQSEWRKKGVH